MRSVASNASHKPLSAPRKGTCPPRDSRLHFVVTQTRLDRVRFPALLSRGLVDPADRPTSANGNRENAPRASISRAARPSLSRRQRGRAVLRVLSRSLQTPRGLSFSGPWLFPFRRALVLPPTVASSVPTDDGSISAEGARGPCIYTLRIYAETRDARSHRGKSCPSVFRFICPRLSPVPIRRSCARPRPSSARVSLPGDSCGGGWPLEIASNVADRRGASSEAIVEITWNRSGSTSLRTDGGRC